MNKEWMNENENMRFQWFMNAWKLMNDLKKIYEIEWTGRFILNEMSIFFDETKYVC